MLITSLQAVASALRADTPLSPMQLRGNQELTIRRS